MNNSTKQQSSRNQWEDHSIENHRIMTVIILIMINLITPRCCCRQCKLAFLFTRTIQSGLFIFFFLFWPNMYCHTQILKSQEKKLFVHVLLLIVTRWFLTVDSKILKYLSNIFLCWHWYFIWTYCFNKIFLLVVSFTLFKFKEEELCTFAL